MPHRSSYKNPFGRLYTRRKTGDTDIVNPPPPPSGQLYDWAPGIYSLPSYSATGIAGKTEFYDHIKNYNFRGGQLRYSWAGIETQAGVYNFSAIDQDLVDMAATGKKLVMLFSLLGSDSVPTAYKTATYDGGVYPYVKGSTGNISYSPCLWDTDLQAKYLTFIDKLAEHMKARPQYANTFYAIGLSEAICNPHSTNNTFVTAQRKADWYAFTGVLLQRMKTKFPGKHCYQWANWNKDNLSLNVEAVRSAKGGLGTPDSFINDPGLWQAGNRLSVPYQGIYPYFVQEYGNMMLWNSIQAGNFSSNLGPATQNLPPSEKPPEYVPTMQQLYDFNKLTLKVSHLFVQRTNQTGSGGLNYIPLWIEFMQSTQITSTPHAGLESAYPSVYLGG